MAPDFMITDIEYEVPDVALSNSDLRTLNPDWNMALIAPKTGVERRHFVPAGKLTSDMALAASSRLLQRLDLAPEKIDGVIFCTQSPDYIMPPNATLLHAGLGLRKDVAAFDFTLACSGYIYGLALAQGLGATLGLKRILLVTGDTYSHYIHPRDRSARTLFGDGVAVSLIEATDAARGSCFVDIDLYTDGTGGPAFMIKAGGLRHPKSEETRRPLRDLFGNERTDEHIVMDGRAVLEFAGREIPPAVAAILRDNGLAMADIDLVLLHQASRTALDKLVSALAIPPEKTFDNIRNFGNTVSASLPILLKDAIDQGRLERGDLLLLVGFGVGLSWGAALIRW